MSTDIENKEKEDTAKVENTDKPLSKFEKALAEAKTLAQPEIYKRIKESFRRNMASTNIFSGIPDKLDENALSTEEYRVLSQVTKISTDSSPDESLYWDYADGVIVVDVKGSSAVMQMTSYLENEPAVKAYDANLIPDPDEEMENETDVNPDETDLNDISPDDIVEFIIALETEYVTYEVVESALPEDFKIENGQVLVNEFQSKRVVRQRQVVRKVVCAKGFKWNPTQNACLKMSGVEQTRLHKQAIRAAKTRKNDASGMRQAIKRRKLSLTVRKKAGL